MPLRGFILARTTRRSKRQRRKRQYKAIAQGILKQIHWDSLFRTDRSRATRIILEVVSEHVKHGFEPMLVDRFEHEIRQHYISQAEVETVVGLLQARGLVQRLEPTNSLAWVLLRPEVFESVCCIRHSGGPHAHPQGIGAISERNVLNGDLPLVGFQRPRISEERPILESTADSWYDTIYVSVRWVYLYFLARSMSTGPHPLKLTPAPKSPMNSRAALRLFMLRS